MESSPMKELLPSEAIMIPMRFTDGKMLMWFSYCSAHQGYDKDCIQCQAGSWKEVCINRQNDYRKKLITTATEG